MSPEQAWELHLPFGKYEGKSLREVAALPAGPGYLRWLRREYENEQRKCKALKLPLLPTTVVLLKALEIVLKEQPLAPVSKPKTMPE